MTESKHYFLKNLVVFFFHEDDKYVVVCGYASRVSHLEVSVARARLVVQWLRIPCQWKGQWFNPTGLRSPKPVCHSHWSASRCKIKSLCIKYLIWNLESKLALILSQIVLWSLCGLLVEDRFYMLITQVSEELLLIGYVASILVNMWPCLVFWPVLVPIIFYILFYRYFPYNAALKWKVKSLDKLSQNFSNEKM